MNVPVNQKVSGSTRLLTILVLITLVFSIFSTVLIIKIDRILIMDRNEHRARDFVEIVVDSINQRTDYYKYHCRKDVLSDIEESIGVISSNYKVTVIESEGSYYRFDLTFDGKNKFLVDVQRWPPNDLEIIHFMPNRKRLTPEKREESGN